MGCMKEILLTDELQNYAEILIKFPFVDTCGYVFAKLTE
jgi:hypothetical protein